MSGYKLSKESENDIINIYEFGVEQFGILQAKDYLQGMHDLFQALANNPNIGRDASAFYPFLKRMMYKSHMVFYLISETNIFIVRVLHHSMDYPHHL